MRFIPTLLIFILMLARLLPCRVMAQEQTVSYAQELASGQRAHEAGFYDSAFQYYSVAYSKGMPRDSLLYLWSGVYLARGTYDTALALNFAVKPAEDQALKEAILRQRYLIYAALGWEQKASEVMDSLKQQMGYRRALLVPDIFVGTSVGYTNLKERIAGTYPWNTIMVFDTTDAEHGAFAGLESRLRWNRLLRRGRQLGFDLGYSTSKPYYVQDGVIDSLKFDMMLYAEAALKNFVEGLSFSVRAGGRRDYLGRYRNVDQADISFVRLKQTRLRAVSAGYSIQLGGAPVIDHQSVWAYALYDRSMAGGSGPALTLLLNAYFAESLAYPYDPDAFVYYVDDVGAGFITHYTDASYSVAVETAGKYVNEYINDINDAVNAVPLSQLYGQSVDAVIPQDNMTFAPSGSWTVKMLPWLSGRLYGGWSIRYYPREVEWFVVGEDEFENYSNVSTRLAYNRADGHYYLLRDQIMANSLLNMQSYDLSNVREVYEDTPAVFTPLVHNAQKRIDNSISVNLSFISDLRRAGDFVLSGGIVRTWSTLGEDCPVEVPEFSWSAQLRWAKTFKASKRLRR